MESTFVFYDLETSGLNKAFDQVLQYAGVRVDQNLEPIEEYEYRVKLHADVLPAPEAICTHGIGIYDYQDAEPEVQAIRHIHQIHNEPGTISGGYNTLGFDDEFLRFSFYRNLLHPYSHQYNNQCGRFDIYAILPFYYLYANDVIAWPSKNGKVSLKLDALNQENNWLTGQAHEAMHDVRVTLELARRLKAHDEGKWQYVMSYFNKQADSQRITQLPVIKHLGEHVLRGGLMISGYFAAAGFVKPVLYLGVHHHYKNQGMWLLLDDLLEIDAEPQKVIIKKKLGEAPFVLPLEERFDHFLSEQIRENIAANFDFIDQNPELIMAWSNSQKDAVLPTLEDCDPDAMLYQEGFRSNSDFMWGMDFHHHPMDKKVSMLTQAPSPIMQTQAARIICRNFPDAAEAMVWDMSQLDQRGCDHLGRFPADVAELLARTKQLMSQDPSAEIAPKLKEYISYLEERGHA